MLILIVDDDVAIAQTLAAQIRLLGHDIAIARDGRAANSSITSKTPDLVLLDYGLPDLTGTELLQSWRERELDMPVVMVSGVATIPDAVRALKLGAQDFLIKPVDLALLEAAIKRTTDTLRLKKENARLKELVRGEDVSFIGETIVIRQLLEQASKVAQSDQPILIEAETGAGKQVLARRIHAQSLRCDEPFVTVNCAAITESLFESELFGHEKGAFTGAVNRKPGKLELVGKGTLFLDEVGEMPVIQQAKLLSALEDRVFERVGGTTGLKFEGRVIAATNRDLDLETERGTFRKDLFYRLSVFRLRIPALRDHWEDIPLYVDVALMRAGQKYKRQYQKPSEDILAGLVRYPWLGNVRELLHHVERAALLSEHSEIPKELWLSLPTIGSRSSGSIEVNLQAAVAGFRRDHILKVLDSCGGNQTEAAKRLGVERTHLNRILAEYEGRK